MQESYKIIFHFSDRPGAPKNIEYQDITANSITLKWKKPDDDGGSDITGM